MRYPLKYSPGHIYLSAIIDIPKLRIRFKPLAEAIIDTGSPETLISESHALAWGIPLNKLNFKKHVNLAGTIFELYELGRVTLRIKDENNNYQKFECDYVYLAKSTKKDEKSKQIAQAIPAILGTNFLLNNKLSLHLTPYKNLAYLESEQ